MASQILPGELLAERAKFIAMSDELSATASRMFDVSVEASRLNEVYGKLSAGLKSSCGHFNLTKISSYEWRCDDCDVFYNFPQDVKEEVNFPEESMPSVRQHPYYGEKRP